MDNLGHLPMAWPWVCVMVRSWLSYVLKVTYLPTHQGTYRGGEGDTHPETRQGTMHLIMPPT